MTMTIGDAPTRARTKTVKTRRTNDRRLAYFSTSFNTDTEVALSLRKCKRVGNLGFGFGKKTSKGWASHKRDFDSRPQRLRMREFSNFVIN
jgi:hypothetical protein